MFNWFGKLKNTKRKITSARIRGRWYGLMFILGEESGRNMSELLKDKGTEVLTMLQLSNEFPEEFKVVSELMKIEDDLKKEEGELPNNVMQRDYILGGVEAKKIKLENRSWADLKSLCDI